MTWYWNTQAIADDTGLTVNQVRSLLAAHRRIGTPGVDRFGRHGVNREAFAAIFGAIAAEHRRRLELEAEMERARLESSSKDGASMPSCVDRRRRNGCGRFVPLNRTARAFTGERNGATGPPATH